MVAPTATISTKRTQRGVRTGVCLSATAMWAADIRMLGSMKRAWQCTLEPLAGDAIAWPSLASAFADLARDLAMTNGSLAISLMPPLAEVRRLELPPVNADELHTLLSRNASRYFANARGPQIVGAVSRVRQNRGALVPVIAATASARMLAAIRAAADASGWTVEHVAPAESAWAGAVPTVWPALTRTSAWVLIAHDDRTDLLQIEGARLAGVRRFRAGATDAALIAATVGRAATIGISGAPASRGPAADALTALGISVAQPGRDWSAIAEQPSLLAAHFAGGDAGPVLRPEGADALDRQRAQTVAWRTASVAAALIVIAAAIELWGVHRQLRLVREERARLQPQIASTLIGRTTVDATYRQVSALGAIDRAAPQWSVVIAAVSAAVPHDAHLTAIRARADSVVVDGLGAHAARVFDALQQTHLLSDVKATAPVRRELQDDGVALDHFTIAARLASPPSRTSNAAALGQVSRRAAR